MIFQTMKHCVWQMYDIACVLCKQFQSKRTKLFVISTNCDVFNEVNHISKHPFIIIIAASDNSKWPRITQ